MGTRNRAIANTGWFVCFECNFCYGVKVTFIDSNWNLEYYFMVKIYGLNNSVDGTFFCSHKSFLSFHRNDRIPKYVYYSIARVIISQGRSMLPYTAFTNECEIQLAAKHILCLDSLRIISSHLTPHYCITYDE